MSSNVEDLRDPITTRNVVLLSSTNEFLFYYLEQHYNFFCQDAKATRQSKAICQLYGLEQKIVYAQRIYWDALRNLVAYCLVLNLTTPLNFAKQSEPELNHILSSALDEFDAKPSILRTAGLVSPSRLILRYPIDHGDDKFRWMGHYLQLAAFGTLKKF